MVVSLCLEHHEMFNYLNLWLNKSHLKAGSTRGSSWPRVCSLSALAVMAVDGLAFVGTSVPWPVSFQKFPCALGPAHLGVLKLALQGSW